MYISRYSFGKPALLSISRYSCFVCHRLFISKLCGHSTVSVWRIAAKICHNVSAFVSPFPSSSAALSQGRGVLDIILETGEDQGAMATMVVQATIQGMEAIMVVAAQITMEIMVVQDTILVEVVITMGVDQITMVGQAITQADLTTMATMEDQGTTLEGEVVLATMATMVDLDTTLVTMATTAVVDQITTVTTEGPDTTLADRITMATTDMVAVGTTLGAAKVGMAEGGTLDPRSTGKWSVPLLEVGSSL